MGYFSRPQDYPDTSQGLERMTTTKFVITLGIQNLLNLLDDEMGVYKYPYYTRTTNIFDVQMTEDFSKYILSPARYYDNRSK